MRYPDTTLPTYRAPGATDGDRAAALRLLLRSSGPRVDQAVARIRSAAGWSWRHWFAEWCRAEGRDPAATLTLARLQ